MACSVENSIGKSHVKYIGDTKASLPHGYGVYAYFNSFFTYEGDWKEGVKDGFGTLKMNDGSYYKGQFTDGEIDGFGKRYWAYSGNTYEGQFEKGEMCGKGIIKYGNGNVYDGHWLDNMKHGDGILTEANGSMYDGSFYYNKRHGEGKKTYSNGKCYEGGWINDCRQGHGKMLFPDSSVYEGQWKADKMHGEGYLSHVSQISYNGMWNNGRPIDEPNIVVGNQEIVIKFKEMAFSVEIECKTADGEVTPESGRCFMVTAGVHFIEPQSSSSRSSSSTKIDSASGQPIKIELKSSVKALESDNGDMTNKRLTPFGYAVEPYPIFTKDISDGEETTEPASNTPQSTTLSVTSEDSTSPTTGSASTSKPDSSEASKLSNEQESDLLPPDCTIVPFERTINGKAAFTNLILPTVHCSQSSMTIVEINETKNSSSRKKEESASGGRRKKVVKPKSEEEKEVAPDSTRYKPGQYVIIIEDITENAFLNTLLEPIYIPIKLPKRSKSTRGASRAAEK